MKKFACLFLLTAESLIWPSPASAETLPAVEAPLAFRTRMDQVHRPRLEVEAAPQAADETAVTRTWRVDVPVPDADGVLAHAAADLMDYFLRSMDVRLSGGEKPEGRIVLMVDPTLKKLQAKLTVAGDRIEVAGATPHEAFQGCCRLEDELNGRGRPCVRLGTRTYTRMFSPRMTHSGYELDDFSDPYLDQIVHAGMDAVLVYIADPPDVSRNRRLDMNDLVRRSAKRGLSVYVYASFHVKASKMHPLDPGARAYYDEIYGSIVKNAPGIRGIICVGESTAFPSRDPKTGGFWFTPEPGKERMNGFWPTEEWVDWLQVVKEVTRQYRPDFDVVFWTYNWFRRPSGDRLKLVERLPTDITLLVTYVRGDPPVMTGGVPMDVDDYSITRPGPSAVFRSEADVAVRRGIRLMAMANTAGRTWDFGCGVPYVPTPDRWHDRCVSLRAAQARWGLGALMDSHHFGFAPSFIADLVKAELTEEADTNDYPRLLADVARREFGSKAAPAVVAAWHDWSEAMRWHSAEVRDLAGPLRVGSVYPLVLPGKNNPPPLRPYVEGTHASNPGSGWQYMCPRYAIFAFEKELTPERLAGEIGLAEREMAFFRTGCDRLSAACEDVPEAKRAVALRLLGLGEWMYHSARTVRNVKRFYRAGIAKDRAALQTIIADERENVKELIPFVERDSSLGWEPTMNYAGDAAALRWKLAQLDDVEKEIEK